MQKLRQLGDIRRDPPRLIGGYQGHSAGTHRKVAWRKSSLESELPMHLVPVLIVAVGLYVLGMIVLALVAILGRVRGNKEMKKFEPELR